MATLGGGGFGGIEGSNVIARLLVVLSGDSAPLEGALAKSEGTLAGFSANAGAIGSALTRNLSLPLLAISGLSIKAATDFSTALGQVAGLTPILDQTGQSIDQLGQSLLHMASDPKIIATPVDLAHSLYLAGSAGLQASEVMNVVRASAEGASVGMGDAANISTVLIAALNNYRGSGITAANAMDTLTVAIKDGTAAPDEMAIALGRLLPVAAAAGVTFEQVTASVAALTNLGVPTRVATTGLRALFSELLAPTVAATKRLNELGISAKQLATTLSTGGPVAAFQLISDAVGGSQAALHDIIPQIRGFTSFLGLAAGGNAKAFVDILDDMKNKTGAFQKALNIISKTPQFQFQKGLQELQIAGIQIGQKLVPVFLSLVHALTAIATIVANMPGPVKAAFAGFLVAGAALGPMVQLYAAITATSQVTTGLGAAGSFMAQSWKAVGVSFLAAGVASAIAVGGFESLIRGGTGLVSILSTLVGSFLAVKLALTALSSVALRGALGSGVISEAFITLGENALPIAGGIALIATAIGLVVAKSNEIKHESSQMGDALFTAGQQGETLSQALKSIAGNDIADQLAKDAEAAHLLGQAVTTAIVPLAKIEGSKLVASLKGLSDVDLSRIGNPGNVSSIQAYVAAIQDAVASGKDLSPVLKQQGLDGDSLISTLKYLSTSDSSLSTAQQDLASSALKLLYYYPQLLAKNKALQAATSDTIQSHVNETSAINSLAAQYGVSVPYMTDLITKFGVTGTAVLNGNAKDFGIASGLIDKSTGAIQGHLQELADAADKAATALSDSLSSSFDLFGQVDKPVKDINKLITAMQAMGTTAVNESANVRTLLERGVPDGLIQQFISAGPSTVAAFATATSGQLKKVVTAYELGLGAMDKSILVESVHQEKKGKNMVERFATAILGATKILPATGQKIVSLVGKGINEGNVGRLGLNLIETFANTLLSHTEITKRAGSQAALAFATGIASGNFIGPKGKLLVQQAADGIASGSSLTKAQALRLVIQISNTMNQNSHKVLASGHHIAGEAKKGLSSVDVSAEGKKFVTDFAHGISGNLSLVDSAVNSLAAHTKQQLDNALKNSPYYFTLPMGEKLVTDLEAGVKQGSARSRIGADLALTLSRGISEDKTFLNVLTKLKDLVKSNLKKGFDEAGKQMVVGLEHTGNELEKQLSKIEKSFKSFKQGIISGFPKDLAGPLVSAAQQFIQDMAQYQTDLATFNASPDGATAPTAPTPVDYTALIQQQVASAQELAKDLTAAAKAGLSKNLISQFAAAGPEAIPVLKALLANPSLISEMNAAAKTINAAANSTADRLGQRFFGKAIQEATDALHEFSLDILRIIRTLVAGLGSKHSDLVKALDNMIQSIQQAIHNTTAVGGSQPSGGPGGPPTKPGAQVPGQTPPIVPRGGGGHQITVNGGINVYGTSSSNPQHLARQIQSELIKISRSNAGKIGITDRG